MYSQTESFQMLHYIFYQIITKEKKNRYRCLIRKNWPIENTKEVITIAEFKPILFFKCYGHRKEFNNSFIWIV